jgi:hypothetical protein
MMWRLDGGGGLFGCIEGAGGARSDMDCTRPVLGLTHNPLLISFICFFIIIVDFLSCG